jgi:hypothetical protein
MLAQDAVSKGNRIFPEKNANPAFRRVISVGHGTLR